MREISNEIKSIVPKTVVDIWVRKIRLFSNLFFSASYRSDTKLGVNKAYRQLLLRKNGVALVPINQIVDWSKLNLILSSPTSNEGQVSHLELLCIVALSKFHLKPQQNFLEIGTYDGNTALNVSQNIDITSNVFTIDLPEDTLVQGRFSYDNYLIKNNNRQNKKHLLQKNVSQIYHDSTTLDFSNINFNAAFIDGGHDYETVKSDTNNVLKYIKKPGFILWHDYDIECEIGDLLHSLTKEYPIQSIEGTRLAYLKLN
jgi:hypothetical protein